MQMRLFTEKFLFSIEYCFWCYILWMLHDYEERNLLWIWDTTKAKIDMFSHIEVI